MEENKSSMGGLGSTLFPLEYTLRKTGEAVEVISFNNPETGARSEEDWVSYIDSEGNEHIKEHLNIQFDFKAGRKMSKAFDRLLDPPKWKLPDIWETRRYELAKEFLLHGLADSAIGSVAMADFLIEKLKTKDEGAVVEGVQMDDGYENIGIGEIVESIDGPERLKKFVFTDKKDIVGYRGDSGRWAVGDRVKVYIKRLEPQEEERPAP